MNTFYDGINPNTRISYLFLKNFIGDSKTHKQFQIITRQKDIFQKNRKTSIHSIEKIEKGFWRIVFLRLSSDVGFDWW